MDSGDSRELIVTSDHVRGDLTAPIPQDADELRREIEETRRQIAASFNDIRSEVSGRVEHALDWRGWVQEHPRTAISLAFGVGLYLGLR